MKTFATISAILAVGWAPSLARRGSSRGSWEIVPAAPKIAAVCAVAALAIFTLSSIEIPIVGDVDYASTFYGP